MKIGTNAYSRSRKSRVFRLSYASRAVHPIRRGEAAKLAEDAAAHNQSQGITGVLFSESGFFLQWLEGPARNVCDIMSRIAGDPRHTDVTLLSSGWIANRRYGDWSMQLADTALPELHADPCTDNTPDAQFGVDQSLTAFEAIAADYHRMRLGDFSSPHDYAQQLIARGIDDSPTMPEAANVSLRTRAHFVDDLCKAFRDGWLDDHWTSMQISVGLAHLNCIWQCAGRIAQPTRPRHTAAIVIPPDSTEILGAAVKADLLRASGIAVHVVRAPSVSATLAALDDLSADAVIVAGSRVGWREEQKRAANLAKVIDEHTASVPTYLGGRATSTLAGWPDRVACLRDDASAIRAIDVDWATLATLATTRAPIAHTSRYLL